MRNNRYCLHVLLLIGVWIGLSLPAAAAPSPTDRYCSHVLKVINDAHKNIPTMTAVSEQVADKLIAGGNLYVAGSDQGFDLEAITRAGGTMAMKLLPPLDQVKPSDAVVISFTSQKTDDDISLAARLSEKGALVIGFGSPTHVGRDVRVDYLFDNFSPKQDCIVKAPRREELLCPTSAVGNAVNLWAFTAELVSACTRKGKMPTMWQSVMVDGARKRNAQYQGQQFHTNMDIQPIAAGVLGKQYLYRLRSAVARIHGDEASQIQLAARKIADVLNDGKAANIYIIGHMPPSEVGGFGDPKFFRVLPMGKQLAGMEQTVTKDDVVVGLVYTGIWTELLDFVTHTGTPTVWILAPTDDSQKAKDRGDILIDQHWVLGDAIVDVPGYDVKILPPSAVTQLTIYWSLVGEIAKRVK